MARPLLFQYAGAEVRCQTAKIDRTKLYGTVDIEAVDDEGRPCELVSMAPDGRTLIARGGRAVAFVTPDRDWIDRAALHPVDPDGEPIVPVTSSFDAPVALEERATPDDLLDHQVKSVYLLEPDAGAEALLEELRGGVIYRFPFAFRAGHIADVGFLLAGQDGRPFLLVAQPTTLHFVGLDQGGAVIEEEEPSPGEEEIDFGMM